MRKCITCVYRGGTEKRRIMLVFEDIIGHSSSDVSSRNIATDDDDWETCPKCGSTEIGIFANGGSSWLMWCAICNYEWEIDDY